MTDATRQIIDYAQNDNGVEFRNALYATIHDKVTTHLAAAKQAVAQNLIGQDEEEEEEEQYDEDDEGEEEFENT
jgi:hypothetical protein